MMCRCWCALAFFALVMLGRAAPLVIGFAEFPFPVPGVSQITDIEAAPDDSGRFFLAQKDGVVRIMTQLGELFPVPFATVSPVFTGSECGLVGMCFDPNFLVNRYVYFFVTVSASEQQIIRYEDANDAGVNKTVLVGGLPTLGANHDGGGLAVGLDGKLYFSIGDLGPGVGVDADFSSMASKVGRCNLDGTPVMFNPYFDGPGGSNDLIWARGFRNPFKLAVQPGTGLIWVNVAGASYEQIFAADKGDHAGWNDYENNQPAAFIKPRVKYRTNGTDTRQIAPGGAFRHDNVITFTTTAAHGFRKGERIAIAGVLDSSFNGNYFVVAVSNAVTFDVPQIAPHAVSGFGTATTFNLGGAVTGGCFYNSTAFPDNYQQNYFFCDINSARINRVTFDATNEVAAVQFFVSGLNGAVDVTTGPKGHLYYAGYGNEVIYRAVHTNNPQRIVVTPHYLNMAEGGIAVVNVRLTSPPASDAIMVVARTAGSAAFSTTNLSLVFTPANYQDTQPVFIEARADADRVHSQATFTLSCPGYPARTFFVNGYDPDHGALGFTGLLRTNNGTRLQVATERRTRVALEASDGLAAWQPLSTNLTVTNAVTLFDNSPVRPQRFYRARIVR